MRGLYFDGKELLYREDLEKPKTKDKESLIKIIQAGICSTDREILKGYRPDFKGILGHEFVGMVEASDDQSLTGKRVVGEINAGCGHCMYCMSGREKHCMERRVIGINKKDGCFAEYMTIKTDLLHVVPENVSDEAAAFTEPLAAALEIPQQIHIKPDTPIALIGDGRLALMIAEVLSLYGVAITVIGKHEEKLSRFNAYADTVLQTDDTFETVIEASGSPEGLLLAMDKVRRQGQIILKSTYAGKVLVDMSQIVVNEIAVTGSRCGPFAPALKLLEKGLIKLPKAELFELKDYEQAFSARTFKAGFTMEAK